MQIVIVTCGAWSRFGALVDTKKAGLGNETDSVKPWFWCFGFEKGAFWCFAQLDLQALQKPFALANLSEKLISLNKNDGFAQTHSFRHFSLAKSDGQSIVNSADDGNSGSQVSMTDFEPTPQFYMSHVWTGLGLTKA